MKEIGSEFDLNPDLIKSKNWTWSKFFPSRNRVFLSTGRDSLTYAIRAYGLNRMLVPSYLEREVICHLLKQNVKIDFYRVDRNLVADLNDLEKKVNCSDSVLVVHYFGYPQPLKEIFEICEGKDKVMIEDCVQSMLSKYEGKPLGSFGDISFNSLRKFIPIPDGSILTISKRMPTIESNTHRKFVQKRMEALLGKFHYLSGDRRYSRFYFKKAFKEADGVIEKFPKPAPMSSQSSFILHRTNFAYIKKIREENFKFLMSKLYDIALFRTLPHNVSPLGFPIIVRNRNKVKDLLIQKKIYPPIHWKLPKIIRKKFRESWQISNHILTIPIDQRYSEDDMKRVVEILQKN